MLTTENSDAVNNCAYGCRRRARKNEPLLLPEMLYLSQCRSESWREREGERERERERQREREGRKRDRERERERGRKREGERKRERERTEKTNTQTKPQQQTNRQRVKQTVVHVFVCARRDCTAFSVCVLALCISVCTRVTNMSSM